MKPRRPAVPRTGRGDRECSGTSLVIARSLNQDLLEKGIQHGQNLRYTQEDRKWQLLALYQESLCIGTIKGYRN
jgi:hypothetical protein